MKELKGRCLVVINLRHKVDELASMHSSFYEEEGLWGQVKGGHTCDRILNARSIIIPHCVQLHTAVKEAKAYCKA